MKNLILCFISGIMLLGVSCSETHKTNPDINPWAIESNEPVVIHAGWVDHNILGITIKQGNLVRSVFKDYVAQPGDSVAIRLDNNGEVKSRTLIRDDNAIGYLAGEDMQKLSIFEKISGDTLDQELLGKTSSYSLKVNGSQEKWQPEQVYRKSKILTKSNATDQISMLHTVYLKIPEMLTNEKEIIIEFEGIHLKEKQLRFSAHPFYSRSEAVHVAQTGFRPDDPVKRGYLSIWLGTGGGHAYSHHPVFSVVDVNSGNIVYKGAAKKALAIDGVEKLREEKNYSKTEVWHLDFKEVTRPGKYMLFVEGIGTSYPFAIQESTWLDAFAVTMKGFLTHRSGIAIDESMNVNFVRPRSFHPDDGVRVYESEFSQFDLWADYGGSQDGAFKGLIANRTDRLRNDAWGGYMDAGDWDRRIPHFHSTRQLLELFVLFPDYFETLSLTLPQSEMNNSIPDLLDEVAWNVDMYGRMQSDNGGISLGVESAAHPVEGEPSWLESLHVMSFSDDPHSSFIYAGVAAKLSGAMEQYDSERAAWYRHTAIKAFDYALRYDIHPRFSELSAGNIASIRDQACLAGIELYKLTGEEKYYMTFRKYARFLDGFPEDVHPGARQLDAAFSLANASEDGVITREDKMIASELITRHADVMLQMLHGNSFNLVNRYPGVAMMNGYYSAANNQELCRAWYLTRKDKYLEGAVLSVMYTAGGNPMNMTMTTGLGHNHPHRPLHLDSEFTGQPAPHGITVYAQADHEFYMNQLSDEELSRAWGTWATYWYSANLNTPSGWEWPPHEAYIDYSRFPSMNEYTIHQTFGPISYAYGFLAARN